MVTRLQIGAQMGGRVFRKQQVQVLLALAVVSHHVLEPRARLGHTLCPVPRQPWGITRRNQQPRCPALLHSGEDADEGAFRISHVRDLVTHNPAASGIRVEASIGADDHFCHARRTGNDVIDHRFALVDDERFVDATHACGASPAEYK